MISQKDVSAFRGSLLRWYRKNRRDLPWRRTRDPYAILVSEFMLQQTQVATVLPYYDSWLRRFPDFRTLARASEKTVLHSWQGLGYYTRARNLHATAADVVRQYQGSFPREISHIRNFPGIGRYTANAIATFAFDQSVPVVETNIARLLARLFNITIPIDSSAGREMLWEHAARLVPNHGAGRFNSALMDLGAMVCLPRAPKCVMCPAKKFCRATRPETLPNKKSRPRTKQLTEDHAFAFRKNKVLLEQSVKRWRGMWILPPLKQRSVTKGAVHTSIFSFTHHRITLRVFAHRPRLISRDQSWFSKRALNSIPIPSPHRRAIVELCH